MSSRFWFYEEKKCELQILLFKLEILWQHLLLLETGRATIMKKRRKKIAVKERAIKTREIKMRCQVEHEGDDCLQAARGGKGFGSQSSRRSEES